MPRFPFILLAATIPALLGANENVPPAEQTTPILVTSATIHPIAGKPVPNGKMLVADGKIEGIHGPNTAIELPAGTRILEFPGKHVYPGMIAANSVLGLTEINAVRATRDMIEPGAINPNARAQISINPDSELIPVCRANGILAALSIPRTGSGGLIAGQSALVRLDGWTWEEMTVASPVGMHVFWPDLRNYPRWNTPAPGDEEMEKKRKAYAKNVAKLTGAFADARAYFRANGQGKTDLRWEAMKPVFSSELPLFIHAQTTTQISDALHFAAAEELKRPVIVGGRDAWRMTSELATQKAAVILSPVNGLPLRRWEAYDTPYVAAARLHEAGIDFCIANSGSSFEAANERNLPYQAARAAAHGLPRDVALKAVTLFPARILGVAGRLGSLEPGKEATFFVSNGDPLEVMTVVETAFVRGREIDLSSKHSRLFRKYQEKYRQQQREPGD